MCNWVTKRGYGKLRLSSENIHLLYIERMIAKKNLATDANTYRQIRPLYMTGLDSCKAQKESKHKKRLSEVREGV